MESGKQPTDGAIPNRELVLQRLDQVLDPELDESILKLGFVESIRADNGHLTIAIRLPTYFCAANFAYLMAQDIRRELLAVEGIQGVTVSLQSGHFAHQEIEAGVNTNKSFSEAFPDEALGDLGQLRQLFLRKGYVKRQAILLRSLRKAGCPFEEISTLGIGDLFFEDGACLVRRAGGKMSYLGLPEVAQPYLGRRAELGLDCSKTSALMMDLQGRPIPLQELEEYWIRARTLLVSLEANGSLCSALLESRRAAQPDGFSGAVGSKELEHVRRKR